MKPLTLAFRGCHFKRGSRGNLFIAEKWLVSLLGVAMLLLMAGCEAEVPYGGACGGVYGEYPYTYYGSGAYYPAPVYVYPYRYRYHYHRAPYDRDHYSDREHFHRR